MSTNTTFLNDVLNGLSISKKHISSKYFYDEKGDKIFQEIMQMPEYYLPASEMDIINTKSREIASLLNTHCDIVELGAGDGTKTQYLLKNLLDHEVAITYYPLDISPAVLKENKEHVNRLMPNLEVRPLAGDYFHTIQQIDTPHQKLILFLGSNIGNFDEASSIKFLSLIRAHMSNNDILVLATDLQKNPTRIKLAYDDPHGITKRFNLNLLHRINTELGGNIDITLWDHYTHYDPNTGVVASYLVSLSNQDFSIQDHSFHIKKYELIHTEVSRKYTLNQVKSLGDKSKLNCISQLTDSEEGFAWSFFKKGR